MNRTGPRRVAALGTGSRPLGRHAARGLSLVETLVATAILAVGAMTAASVLVTSMKLDAINRENAAAFSSARTQLESLRSEKFEDLVAMYDDDPANDPGGADTAPGATIDSATLGDLSGDLSCTTATVALTLTKLGGKADAVVQVLLPLDGGGEVREDLDMPELGLPADLNGDGAIDALDHRGDAIVLPVGVRVTWTGSSGSRSIVLTTMVHE